MFMCVCVCVCVFLCVFIIIHMHVFVFVRVCVHIIILLLLITLHPTQHFNIMTGSWIPLVQVCWTSLLGISELIITT